MCTRKRIYTFIPGCLTYHEAFSENFFRSNFPSLKPNVERPAQGMARTIMTIKQGSSSFMPPWWASPLSALTVPHTAHGGGGQFYIRRIRRSILSESPGAKFQTQLKTRNGAMVRVPQSSKTATPHHRATTGISQNNTAWTIYMWSQTNDQPAFPHQGETGARL